MAGVPGAAGQTSVRLGLSNSLRSTLGRNFVNEARVGYSGAPVKFFDELNTVDVHRPLANQKGFQLQLPERRQAADTAGHPGAPTPQSRDATDLTIEDTITWLKGNHNITGGASWTNFNVWLKNSSLVPRVTFGLLQADPAHARLHLAAMQAATGVAPRRPSSPPAQNLYSFLTGRVSSITANARLDEDTSQYVYVGEGTQRSTMQEFGFFVQDSVALEAEPHRERRRPLRPPVPVHGVEQQLLDADARGRLRHIGRRRPPPASATCSSPA